MSGKTNFGDAPQRWKKGDKFSAKHLNEGFDLARRMAGFVGNEDLNTGGDPTSTTLTLIKRLNKTRMCVAKIVNQGPSGEPDYTNQLYWIKMQSVNPATGTWEVNTFVDNPPSFATNGTDYADIFPDTAENLGERIAATHLMPTDGSAFVWCMGQSDDNGFVRWVFEYVFPVQFDAVITTYSQDGSNKRWLYSFLEVDKTGAGYSGYTTRSGGRVGTCYNRVEYINGSNGLFGNGVSSSNLIGTFTLQPIPVGTPVCLTTKVLTDGTTLEYWFTEANGVDGGCA